jgi:uroporphyrin-III C-methyltransferase/precorrin-2 dehydrogenase/sirohydrochlorin ferrochelatase
MMPAGLGGLAQALGKARSALRARWPDGADRRRAIDAAFDPGGPLDPFGAGSAAAVAAWLDAPEDGATAQFHHIPLHSDDPDDLTLAQARLLARADLVLHQARVAPAIVDRARADATRQLCEAPPAHPPSGMVIFLERL